MQFNPIKSLKDFYSDSRHIISVSYKPGMEAFKRTLKIVLIGIVILGVLGFILALIINLILG